MLFELPILTMIQGKWMKKRLLPWATLCLLLSAGVVTSGKLNSENKPENLSPPIVLNFQLSVSNEDTLRPTQSLVRKVLTTEPRQTREAKRDQVKIVTAVPSKALLKSQQRQGVASPGQRDDMLMSFSQQVSKIIDAPLLSAAGGSKGSKKSFTKGKKSVDGGKKKKGFKDEHGHKKHKKGHHSNARKKKFFEKGGKFGHGHSHEKDYSGSYKKGSKASKGFKKGIRGHHSKGHRDKGFQHKQHKQAYGFKKKFNDVGAFKKHFSDHGLFGKKQAGFSGMSKKASRFKGGSSHFDHGYDEY